MAPRALTLEGLLDHFRPGAVIAVPGAVGELAVLREALAAEPGRMAGVTLVAPLIPGMNGFDYAGLDPAARLRVFMMSDALRASFEAGRVELMPLRYTDTAAHLRTLQPDVAILHLTPPAEGVCSFGVSGDFGPMAAASAKVKIGAINRAMPRPARGVTIPFDALDAVVEIDAPLPTFAEAEPTPVSTALAARVADLVPDGAAVQTGIGAAPAAVWRALERREGLVLRSGMVTDGFLRAWRAGGMAKHGHRAGVAMGSRALLEWLDGQDHVAFADVDATHGAAALAGMANFTAVNSALEIDLFGQANLEWQGGRAISGVGGAPDFVRAARLSPGGRAILALPSTARDGSISRIVPRLAAPTVSLPRGDADVVVTEHGAADVRHLGLDARAEALIAIADPAHRSELTDRWREMRKGL